MQSFHTASGEPSDVPPTAVTFGSEAGYVVASEETAPVFVEVHSFAHPSEPESPDAARTVWPWEAALASCVFTEGMTVKSVSHCDNDQLSEMTFAVSSETIFESTS